MKLLQKWLVKIDEYFSKNEKIYIDELEKGIDELQDELLFASEEIVKLESVNKEITDALILKVDNQELKEYWNNKYKKGIIIYPGRSLPFADEKVDVPVNVLITPNDPFIIQDLNNWGLMGNADTDWETHLIKIYRTIRDRYYKYQYDKTIWGNEEVWEFPFEMRAKGFGDGFDCDSWAHFQLSYYIAAGLPNWRARVVVGDCKFGGHSTVYIYSLRDNEWHHLNSTYGRNYSSIKEYPTHSAAENNKDDLGIYNVWLSFNNEFSWYKFTNDIPTELKSRRL